MADDAEFAGNVLAARLRRLERTDRHEVVAANNGGRPFLHVKKTRAQGPAGLHRVPSVQYPFLARLDACGPEGRQGRFLCLRDAGVKMIAGAHNYSDAPMSQVDEMSHDLIHAAVQVHADAAGALHGARVLEEDGRRPLDQSLTLLWSRFFGHHDRPSQQGVARNAERRVAIRLREVSRRHQTDGIPPETQDALRPFDDASCERMGRVRDRGQDDGDHAAACLRLIAPPADKRSHLASARQEPLLHKVCEGATRGDG